MALIVWDTLMKPTDAVCACMSDSVTEWGAAQRVGVGGTTLTPAEIDYPEALDGAWDLLGRQLIR
jgi:hypothetical protein